MTKQRGKEINALFKWYKSNKKALAQDYNIPVPSGVSYDKISVQTDKTKNPVEHATIEYISKREELFKKVFIVEETLNWFKLEGHGRERLIEYLLIDRHSWTETEIKCRISRHALSTLRNDAFEKAEMLAKWVNYF